MRVANYYRVSTKLQEKKFSLSAQKVELKAYAAQQGWELIDEFVDVETGGKLDKTGLTALLDLVEDGYVDAVLCMDQDRLSRLDTVSWEYLKSVLRDNAVKIAEPGNIIDLTNEDDEFMSDIRNIMARRDKRNTVKRMMYGKRQRLREGKGWGQGPFEYEYDRTMGFYFIKPGWGWVIPMIDSLYLKEQLGMDRIAQSLNEISFTPTGKPWNNHLIETRIKTKAFHGVMEKDFNSGETIATPGVYEPMRSEETYNRLQEERIKRGSQFSVSGRKNTNNIHMLKRTALTCGLCGRRIYVATHGIKNRPLYYAKHGRKRSVKDQSFCGISINSVRFDDNLAKALKDILSGEDVAKNYIQIDFDENEVSQLKQKVNDLEQSVEKLNESADRLLDLYISGSKGLTKEKYTQKENDLTARIKEESKLLQQYKDKLQEIDLKSFSYENLYEYMEIVSDLEKDLTNLEKAQLMGTVFPKGTLYEDKLVLVTEMYKNIPIEIKVPINPDPYAWHHTKNP